MNLKYFTTAVLATALLFSCSSNNGDTPEPEPTGKTAKAVITFDNESITRAVSFPTGSALGEEKHVTNLAIFVFTNQMIFLDYAVIDGIRNSDGSIAYSSDLPVEFEVPVGRNYVMAFANVPKSFLDWPAQGVSSMSDFQDVIFQYTLADLTGEGFFGLTDPDDRIALETRGFFMSTRDGYLPIGVIDTDDVSQNTFTVNLVRGVAKVAVAFDPVYPNGGELVNVQYILGNNPKTMYAMERYNGSALMTPNYNDASVIASNYQDPLDDYQNVITPTTSNAADLITYCMENSNLVPREGNATYALIRGNFIPDAMLDDMGGADGSYTPNPSSPQTFWRIKTTESDGSFAYEPYYYSSEPDASILASDQTTEQFVGGVCYYPVWLSNPNSGAENKYTVKRNSYYKLTINSVSGAGYKDPDEAIDPPLPLDRIVPINVGIVVDDWDEVNSEQGV